jgi:hypothetical protein
MSKEKLTWNVGVVEVDGEKLVGFQFGLGDDPPVVDLEPDYALRIASALRSAATEAKYDG